MLLALNIGNTNVTFGGYDSAGQRVFASRFYSDSALSSDELVYKLVNMLALYHIQPRDVDAAILASVVPVLTSRMREALEKMTNAPLMEVGPGLKSGVRIPPSWAVSYCVPLWAPCRPTSRPFWS
mgnify:CR=1 FL=1